MAAEYEADLGVLALRKRVSGQPPPRAGCPGGRRRAAPPGGAAGNAKRAPRVGRTAAAIPSGASGDRRGEAPGREGGMRAVAAGSRLRVRAADIRRGRASDRTNTPWKRRIFSLQHLNSPTNPPDNAFAAGIADSLRYGSESAARDVDSSSITQIIVMIDRRRKAFSRSGDRAAAAAAEGRRELAKNGSGKIPSVGPRGPMARAKCAAFREALPLWPSDSIRNLTNPKILATKLSPSLACTRSLKTCRRRDRTMAFWRASATEPSGYSEGYGLPRLG